MGPSFGEYYVTRVLDALTSNPEVWARTVFILSYDGRLAYDHASAPVPPWKDGVGLSTVSTAGEIEASSGLPIGLGHRVPLIAISPGRRAARSAPKCSTIPRCCASSNAASASSRNISPGGVPSAAT